MAGLDSFCPPRTVTRHVMLPWSSEAFLPDYTIQLSSIQDSCIAQISNVVEASWHLPRTLSILSMEACFHPVLSVCGQHPCSTEWTLSILFISFYLLQQASEETLCMAINCRIHKSILDCLLISTICNHPKTNYFKELSLLV